MSISLLRYTGLAGAVAMPARTFATSSLAFKIAAAAAAAPKATKAKAAPAKKPAAAAKTPAAAKKPTAKKEKIELPTVPKSPASPYALFFKDFYTQNKQKFADPKTGKFMLAETSRAAGVAWSQLSLLETDKYTAAYKAAHAAWAPKYREFYENLTPETRRAIEAHTGRKLKVPGGKVNARREFANLPGNPGRPSSSFFEYLREIKPALIKEGEAQHIVGNKLNIWVAKKAGERWRGLSESQKAHYKQLYDDKKVKFDAWMATQKSKP